MSSYLDGLKDAVRGAVCFVADKVDSAATYTFGTPPGSVGGSACNDPTPPPPTPPPFTGGQCDTMYEVRAECDRFLTPSCSQSGRTAQSADVLGPITSIERFNEGASRCGNAAWQTMVVTHASPGGGVTTTRLSNSGTPDGLNESGFDLTVTRLDGDPDICGDPPPPPPPPIPTQPINFTYTNNEGDDIDVSGDLDIFAPILIAPFTLVAPIRVDLGGITFDGTFQFSPNVDVTLSPTFGGDGQGDDPQSPVPPSDEDPDEEDPDEPTACEDTPLKGLSVVLRFSADMRSTEVRQDGSLSSLAVPRAGILYFVAKANNRDVWMPGIDLKSRSQFIPVPFNAVVTCWRIHTEPGVTVVQARPVFDFPT